MIGYGDTEIGLKRRLIDQDDADWTPDLPIYPNIELPTGGRHDGLGAGYTRLLLPIWLQKDIGDWSFFGGAGYWLNHAGANRDYWFTGLAALRKITETLSLGGEGFHTTPQVAGGRGATGINLGGTFDLDETDHLLFSAGRGTRDAAQTNQFSFYLGYQVTF